MNRLERVENRGDQEARRQSLRSRMTVRSVTKQMTQITDKFGITRAPQTK